MNFSRPEGFYILEGELFRLADTWKEVEDFQSDFANRRVALDFVIPMTAHVSTVFLGTDHSWGNGTPILFESMIFSQCELDGTQDRYHTYEAALTGHRIMLELLTLNIHKGYYKKTPATQQHKDLKHE